MYQKVFISISYINVKCVHSMYRKKAFWCRGAFDRAGEEELSASSKAANTFPRYASPQLEQEQNPVH